MTEKKLRLKIKNLWQKIFINRKYKDVLFRKIFHDKEQLLSLYNAVNHTQYMNPDELEITTIENTVYMSMKNDLSFMIAFMMNLYEHQSTINPNMPVRGLLYFARLYENYINDRQMNIYGKKLVKLPMPQYVVFYNGRQEQPDEVIMKLSDAFVPIKMHDGRDDVSEPAIECRVRMLNINLGHNLEMMQGCRRLWEYSYFVEQVNQYIDGGNELKAAINKAMDDCIQKDVLKDILVQSRSEVCSMLLTEYDAKKHMRITYEEGREEGLEQGEERMLRLVQILIETGNADELNRIAADKKYREQQYKKNGLL